MSDNRRAIPAHKLIPAGKGLQLLVDGFQHASKAPKGTMYFLTHAHSDHYTGLRPDWNLGPIYCSETTARLASHILSIDLTHFHPLPLNCTTSLPGGLEVTLVDANHCPGAVLFLFQLPNGQKIVHTGDFRFHAETMLCCPHLAKFKGANEVFLDTTYCSPKHIFPPQEESVEYIAETIHRMMQEERQEERKEHGEQEEGRNESNHEEYIDDNGDKKKILFLISTYVIGKERILEAVAARCGVKIYISDRKAGVMACLGLSEGLFTSDPKATPVHVVPMSFLGETWPYFRPNFTTPAEYMADRGVDKIVGFVPTGWVHDPSKGGGGFPIKKKGEEIEIHLVPYSEHSSYEELQQFVGWLRPHKVVPTVGASDDKALSRLLKHFTLLTDSTASKAKFLSVFTRGGSGGGASNKESIEEPTMELLEDKALGDRVEEKEEVIIDLVQTDGASDEEGCLDDGVSDAGEGEEAELVAKEETEALAAAAAAAGPSGSSAPATKQIETLIALSGGALSGVEAERLLSKAGGNVGRAADMLFSSGGSGGGDKGGDTKQTTSRPPTATVKKQVNGGGNGGNSIGSKRRRSDAGLGAGQQSILSFLGKEQKIDQPVQQQKQQRKEKEKALESAVAPFDPSASAPSPPPAAASSPPLLPQQRSMMLSPSVSSAAAGAGDRSAKVPSDAVTLSLADYNPVAHAPWKPGTPTPYLHLARAFEAMDSTTKRLKIGDALTNAFRSVLALSPGDVVSTAYLAVGKIGPDYEGTELNVGGSTVAAAISESTGVTRARLRTMYNEMGDLGDVAAACKRTQSTLSRPAPLTIAGVFATLRGISGERGAGATGRRQRAVLSMIRSCREAEAKYLVRTLVQALRIGANWRSIIPALAKAVRIHQEQSEALQEYMSQQSQQGQQEDDYLATTALPKLPAPPPKAELDAVGAAATAAFHVCPNLELLLAALQEGPAEEVAQRCRLTPGIPIKPMLAKISEGIADAVTQLKKGADSFVAEYKYDGVRAQIHVLPPPSPPLASPSKNNSSVHHHHHHQQQQQQQQSGSAIQRVKVFSRNCEDRSASFPDVAAQVLEAAQGGASSFILDAEVVPVDRTSLVEDSSSQILAGGGSSSLSVTPQLRLRPFQELASRPRGPVDISALSVSVCVFIFDILEVDGESLLALSLQERRAALLQALPNLRPGYVQLAQGFEVTTTTATVGTAGTAGTAGIGGGNNKLLNNNGAGEEEVVEEEVEEGGATAAVAQVQAGLMEALAAGAEGLMLKALSARYEPSKRSDHWIKLKRDYCVGLHDTLDLVPIGAWHGSGRKAGWFSPFLLAAWDPDTEEFQSLCRCMSGFTDEFYKAATARLKESIIPTRRTYYNTLESPDVWFDAREVWEIRGADITVSPVHRAAVGRVHDSRGVGLRFPRFLRIRDDKGIEDATTASAIAGMYLAQERKVERAVQAVAEAAEQEKEEEEGDG